MQKPLPEPNVMLPALRLSDPPDLDSHLAFKRREAIWKQLISTEHKKWCLCGSFLNHFLPKTEPLRSCTRDGGEESGEPDPDEGDMVVIADTGEEEDIFMEGLPRDEG
nr:ORF2 [Torque teno felis virus]